MQGHPPAASARPDIISLDVLLNDVDEGRVQIPRFQRPYIWTPQMMRELFESVLSGYPIGSLLFWAPREPDVRTMAKIGPLPAPDKPSDGRISLVLDGHQRLATLYGVLRLPASHPKDEGASSEKLGWWLGYDLADQEPCQMRKAEDFYSPRILPMRSVLRTVDFVRFARSIDANKELSSKDKQNYLDRADSVQRAIRDYRIALTIMRDGNVDDAVAIFSRINRSGRRMTADQMAVALTYRDGFNLEDTLDEILGSLEPFGFGDVSRKIVLQSLLEGAERNFTRPNFDDLRRGDTQDALQTASSPVKEALRRAAKFLNADVGFSTGKLLPYALQLLLLGVFFRLQRTDPSELSRSARTALLRWFWATSFSGWFASANSAEVERAVEAMKKFARSDGRQEDRRKFDEFFMDRPLRPFPKTFDRRSARIRAMLLVQINGSQLMDPIDGGNVNGSALMADPDRRDLPYVFPPDGSQSARSPANRILLPRVHGRAVRGVIASQLGKGHKLAYTIQALRSHGVSSAARDAIVSQDLATFVQAREARLRDLEGDFLSGFELQIGSQVEQSDEESDSEDE